MRWAFLTILSGCCLGFTLTSFTLAGPKPKDRLHEKLERYSSDSGRFRVLMPDDDDDENTTLATVVGPVRVETVRGDIGRSLNLSVSYSDFPDAFSSVSKVKLYDGLREALKGVDGTIENEKDYTPGRDGPLGREFTVTGGKNKIRCRVVLVGTRLYQIMAVGERDFVDSQTVAEFFDSFELMRQERGNSDEPQPCGSSS